MKYAARLGVTAHEAAALVIGRSGQQRKERVPRSGPLAVPGMAAALPFVVPVWKATENGEGAGQHQEGAHIKPLRSDEGCL